MSERKSPAKVKLNATSQEERIHQRKQHFENLLGKLPKFTHEPITKKLISDQQDNQTRTVYARKTRLSTKKNLKKEKKAAWFDERPTEIWKIREFDDILLRHCNAVYNQNTIDNRDASSLSQRRVALE